MRRAAGGKVVPLARGFVVLISSSASGGSRATSRSKRRLGREKRLLPDADARAALAKSSGFMLQHSHDDPPARYRQLDRAPGAAATGTPTRSCSCAPIRRITSSRTSRSRATCASRSPALGDDEDQRRDCQVGGPALAIKTIQAFTGVAIDHVVVVDFNGFKDLIDAEAASR